uniref:Diels-Alderase gNR600 n=1 Tax=Fungal sp. (strain NRRL 50135) TaxID=1547289 RepID=PRL3_FUNXX|nr:RecName: Full=Diels-Alderase gNR600; AltName: Full=Pyrrolocin biosynthesis protein gNR600 [fungal sp. NRRL 50135]AIP87501.1 hypothetical protein gNR600 [fungal sp. NRRL 50135]
MAGTFVSVLDISGDSVVTGPVPVEPFVPGSANLFPKMTSRINDTAWELWEFEGFSAGGEAAVGVSLYRDARGVDKGGFHAEVNAIWPDGRKWGQTLYFAESIVTAEGASPDEGRIHGFWRSNSNTAGGAPAAARSITFSISEDLGVATVCFSVPDQVTGTIELRSSGSNRKSCLPATEEAALLYPSVYYMFPMGPVDANADLTFSFSATAGGEIEEERKLSVQSRGGGHGGMVRGWSTEAWPQFMNDAYYVVAKVGSYMLQMLRVVGSAAAGHRPYAVARLYLNKELVCAANQAVDAQSAAEGSTATTQPRDMVAVEKVLSEPKSQEQVVSGAFSDKNIGYVIEFISGQQKRWRFDARHKRAWWSEPTSAPGPGCTGKSGWIEGFLGGSDGETFEGAGVGGQLQIPVP